MSTDEENRTVTIDVGDEYEWVVEMVWPEGETHRGPAALVVRPSDPESYPGSGINSSVLRGIDFSYAAERLRAQLSSAQKWDRIKAGASEARFERLQLALTAGVSDEYLAQLAKTYLALISSGQSKPVEQMAEGLGRPLSTVRNHLWQARKRGLLQGVGGGRKGGELTAKATAILADVQG